MGEVVRVVVFFSTGLLLYLIKRTLCKSFFHICSLLKHTIVKSFWLLFQRVLADKTGGMPCKYAGGAMTWGQHAAGRGEGWGGCSSINSCVFNLLFVVKRTKVGLRNHCVCVCVCVCVCFISTFESVV